MTILPLLALLIAQTGAAPKPEAKKAVESPATSATAEVPPFVLHLKGGISGTVEIHATQVETKAIVDKLKAVLKIPILATVVVSQHKVDLTLKNAPVVQLFLSLAPVVLADLEVGAQPDDTVWKAIHLIGFNEKRPGPALKQVGFLLAAGNTDDESVTAEDVQAAADKEAAKGLEGQATPEKPMLAVAVKDGRMSVRAKGQNLAVILNEIAIRAGVPFDIRGAVDVVPVDIEFKDMPLLSLPLVFGRPDVRLVVRRDLATGEDMVQGILAGDARSPLR